MTNRCERPRLAGLVPPLWSSAIADQFAQQHRGRWVAIHEDRIVAVGGSPTEVHEQAVSQGIDDPLLFQVPRQPERARI